MYIYVCVCICVNTRFSNHKCILLHLDTGSMSPEMQYVRTGSRVDQASHPDSVSDLG